jgi:hypothetical protein
MHGQWSLLNYWLLLPINVLMLILDGLVFPMMLTMLMTQGNLSLRAGNTIYLWVLLIEVVDGDTTGYLHKKC